MRVREIDYAALRRLIGQWRQISPNYYGDFYPLTPWSRDDTLWIAWQFDRPEDGEGAVQAFRREPRNQQIFEALNADYRRANERAFKLVAIFAPFLAPFDPELYVDEKNIPPWQNAPVARNESFQGAVGNWTSPYLANEVDGAGAVSAFVNETS